MGQIVIDIPNKKTRRYVLADAARAEELLVALELSAVRIKNISDRAERQRLEDIRDGEAALKSLEDYRKTGISYSVDNLREKYGLA